MSLDREEIEATAVAAAGHSDFGDDDGWRTHFTAFMDALDAEARLHPVGALMTRTDLVRALLTRLELTDRWANRPEILAEPVPEPLVIVGAARSGTSILHELLALDPAMRAVRSWEANQPVAAADDDTVRHEHARRSADAIVTLWHDVQPEYETMHRNGGELPTECIFLTVPAFLSDNWGGTHTVPSYRIHLATADHSPAYAWHRRTLQTLQHGRAPRRWVLKAPSHLATLPTLFATYPDARVVHIHRDPARTLPSMFDLMATLQWMRSDHVDPLPEVPFAVDGIAGMLDRIVAGRADGSLPDDRFIDVRYADLMTDPIGTVAHIHRAAGSEPPPTLADDVQSYLGAKPKGVAGTHHYDLATFGLTARAIHDRFRTYLERFDIPVED